MKVQLEATICSLIYFTAKSLYMFRVSPHPTSGVLKTVTAAYGTGHNIGTATSLQSGRSCHLYRRLWLKFLVLLMMGAVTPETCRVTLQRNKSDCILLHLVGLLFNVNYDARNHELKTQNALLLPLQQQLRERPTMLR